MITMIKIFLSTIIFFGTIFFAFSQPITMKFEKDGVWIKDAYFGWGGRAGKTVRHHDGVSHRFSIILLED